MLEKLTDEKLCREYAEQAERQDLYRVEYQKRLSAALKGLPRDEAFMFSGGRALTFDHLMAPLVYKSSGTALAEKLKALSLTETEKKILSKGVIL